MTKKKDPKDLLKVGRPTKYRPEMLPKIIEIMKEGASQVEVCGLLGISHDTLHRWKKEIPEFSDTISHGIMLSNCWWEKKGRKNLENKDFSATLWYMNMRNRFDWRDKTSHDHSGKVTLESLLDESFKEE